MARRRRKRRPRSALWALVVLVIVSAGFYWVFLYEAQPGPSDTTLASTDQPALTTDRPEVAPNGSPRPGVPERGESALGSSADRAAGPAGPRASQLLAAGRRALTKKEWITAREYLSEAMELGVEPPDLVQVRADLTRASEETIFSARVFDNDPFTDRYIVQPGDSLGKIANRCKVSADFLASINGLKDKNLIRVGQTLKVVHGPFHADIDTSTFAMVIYLGEGGSRTFVRSFKVGLGAEGSTPRGQWQVRNKLVNPTYYPPRGGQIVTADDPENPLGERWIGLAGVSGEAVGQERYGIHGTVDPDSIGQSVSLGCIRMYNEDVEALFDYLVVKHSKVAVR